MSLGKPLRQAILDGAAEVATPALVATLSICIVFVPIMFLGGVGGALFAPLSMSVVFAMLASYLLSRTLVPTMVLYLLAPEAHAQHGRDADHDEEGGQASGAGQPIRHSSGGSPTPSKSPSASSPEPTKARSTGG
jgi:multidrug efflux pump subunit AcrB